MGSRLDPICIIDMSIVTICKDAGPTTKDSSHGIYLHNAIAVTPDKVCLGVLSSKQNNGIAKNYKS